MSLISELTGILGSRLMRVQLALAVVATIVAIGVQLYQEHEKERLRAQNLTYENQLKILTQVQASMDNLKDFVGTQKKQLQDQQSVLEALKSEREKLTPLVDADRKVVDALFRVQAEHNRTSIWTDRLIGFLLGVVSSLVASVIVSAIRGRKSNQAMQRTAGRSDV